jgi:hypothetical protein
MGRRLLALAALGLALGLLALGVRQVLGPWNDPHTAKVVADGTAAKLFSGVQAASGAYGATPTDLGASWAG